MKHFAYFLECADGTLYAGYTTDVDRRVVEHNESYKGAKYTSSKRPVTLVYVESFLTRSEAMKREAEFKSWTRSKKVSFLQEQKAIIKNVYSRDGTNKTSKLV